MSATTLSRREILSLLGLGVPGLAVLQACGPGSDTVDRLQGFFPDRASAAEVGRAYLQRHPAESDVDTLVSSIVGDPPVSADDLVTDVLARHREDFARGRTVTVRGWVLSGTEARLCALAALAVLSR